MYFVVRFLVFSLIILITLSYFISGWKQDRRPIFMGDKIPIKTLIPNSKRVQKKIVVFHNYFRTKVVPRASNMLKMKWHKGAARSAQKWANHCMFLTHDNVTGRHIHNYGACGQNIFVSSHQVPWLFAVKSWYLEKDNFTYGSNKNDLKLIGHYTQMVWASTHEIGCGFAKCQRYGNVQGKTYYNYVCNYCPIGNRLESIGLPYKSGKPCKLCKKSCHLKKLCTNYCRVADFWANCKELFTVWPNWLCDTKTPKGRERLNSCKATCLCKDKLHD